MDYLPPTSRKTFAKIFSKLDWDIYTDLKILFCRLLSQWGIRTKKWITPNLKLMSRWISRERLKKPRKNRNQNFSLLIKSLSAKRNRFSWIIATMNNLWSGKPKHLIELTNRKDDSRTSAEVNKRIWKLNSLKGKEHTQQILQQIKWIKYLVRNGITDYFVTYSVSKPCNGWQEERKGIKIKAQ